MRLIDADALRGPLMAFDSKVLDIVDNAPTIEQASLIEKPVYLDAEKVAKIVMERLENNGTIYIDGPMIEYVSVRHGRWEEDWLTSTSGGGYRVWRCNLCGDTSTWKNNYCPNCGARMDGGEEDDG